MYYVFPVMVHVIFSHLSRFGQSTLFLCAGITNGIWDCYNLIKGDGFVWCSLFCEVHHRAALDDKAVRQPLWFEQVCYVDLLGGGLVQLWERRLFWLLIHKQLVLDLVRAFWRWKPELGILIDFVVYGMPS